MEEPGEMSPRLFFLHHTLTIVIPAKRSASRDRGGTNVSIGWLTYCGHSLVVPRSRIFAALRPG